MRTDYGYLTFCTNIFPGLSWASHFSALRKEIPQIKGQLAPDQPLGIGLRLSDTAAQTLSEPGQLAAFKEWLTEEGCMVFTMNGFPFGNFHGRPVKDQVHVPDWTTPERLAYTIRLFHILSALLPEGFEGSISTSPLSYKHWIAEHKQRQLVFENSTRNVVALVTELYRMGQQTGQWLHLDLEPEADGLIENTDELLDWYRNWLLPMGREALQAAFSLSATAAEAAIRRHVQLCYDVCHFAVGFEQVDEVLARLQAEGIRIGKWQLSAALKAPLPCAPAHREAVWNTLRNFDEPVYLHQVVARMADGQLLRFRDLPDAFSDPLARQAEQWRSHFHVPLFIQDYGQLQSTQEEVIAALRQQKAKRWSPYMEVETYTWEVLPEALKLPLTESIIRELQWVTGQL